MQSGIPVMQRMFSQTPSEVFKVVRSNSSCLAFEIDEGPFCRISYAPATSL